MAFETKIENGGTTPQGRLSAAEWNALVSEVNNSLRQHVITTKTLLYRRIEIVHPTDWTSTEGLAAWIHTRRQHYLLSSASALFSPTDGQLYEIGTACNDLPVGTGGDIHIKMVINGKNNLVRLYVAVEPYNYVQIQTAGTVTYAGSSQAEFDSITPTVPCRSLDIAELNEKITSILDDLNTHSADISNLEQRISGVGEVHESEFQDLAQRIQTNGENIEAVGQAVTENYAELDDRLFINETETEQQRADINALQNKIKNNLIKQSTFTTKTLLYRRIDIVHHTDWTSTEGLAAWVHTRRQHYLLSSASALFSPTDGQLYEIGTACNDLPVGTTDADIHIKMVISGKNNLVRLYVAVEPYNYVQIETAGTVTYAGSNQAEFDSITPTVPCRSLDIAELNEKITSILDDLSTHSADISNLEIKIQTNAENIEAVGQTVTENYAELDDRLFINETETEQQRADINALQNKIGKAAGKDLATAIENGNTDIPTSNLIYHHLQNNLTSGGLINLLTITTTTLASYMASLGNNGIRFFIITDSQGKLPSLTGETMIPITSPSMLLLFGKTESFGANVGDILAVTKLTCRIIPLNDAKPTTATYHNLGADGLCTVWDKGQINKIAAIETTANAALPKTLLLPSKGTGNMNDALETGIYPWCTLGRPAGSTGAFTCIVHRSSTPDYNNFFTIEQTAYGREAELGQVYKRIIFWRSDEQQYGEWIRVDSKGSSLSFADLTGKPDSLSGYGIQDAYTKGEIDEGLTTILSAFEEEIQKKAEISLSLDTANADDCLSGGIYYDAYTDDYGSGKLVVISTSTSAENLKAVEQTFYSNDGPIYKRILLVSPAEAIVEIMDWRNIAG